MSLDNQASIVRARGRDFPIINARAGEDAQARTLQSVVLALYALDDKRVDAVLMEMKFCFVWPDGKKERLFPK